MRTDEHFHHYFRKAQELAIRAHHDVKARQELLHLIELERKKATENLPYDRFLQGEHAFFSRKYPLALKCYLKSQAIPYFKLFCYRASTFISRAKGEISRALNFAKQALNIYPYDYVTLSIYEELLTLDHQEEEACHIRQRLLTLETQHTSMPKNEPEEENTEEAEAFTLPASNDDHQIQQQLSDVSKEPTMHIPPGFLASPEEKSTEATATLTQRLYKTNLSGEDKFQFSKSLHELQRLSRANPTQSPLPTTFIPQKSAVIMSDCKKSLEENIRKFSQQHHERLTRYLEQYKSKPSQHNNCLYLLHGSDDRSMKDFQSLLLEKTRKMTGGYYLRWNNKGIVFNPGVNFLSHFHQQGLHIRDIDFIIVTSSNMDSYADIKEIYELNYQLNKVASNPQVIHYYLSPQSYQVLSPILKPNFKQERNSVHRLELFLDSPEGEKLDLADGIVLHYFPIGMPAKNAPARNGKEESASVAPSQLGIKLDLQSPSNAQERHSVRLGYVSGAPWSPLLAHSLGSCDILIAGFGITNPNDYNKRKYNEDCLGYFGCYSLLEEVHPKLLICSEFNGAEGDIRLDAVKMMRQEYATAYPTIRETPIVLPADSNLFIELDTLQVLCSLTKEVVPADSIRVSKSAANFGGLNFLSPSCCS